MSTTLPGRSRRNLVSNTAHMSQAECRLAPKFNNAIKCRGVHFRVWAPKRETDERDHRERPGEGITQALTRADEGYFEAFVEGAGAVPLSVFRLMGRSRRPIRRPVFSPAGRTVRRR